MFGYQIRVVCHLLTALLKPFITTNRTDLIRVLHLSTFHLSGGAGLAASRLNRALNKHGAVSHLLAGRGSGREEAVASLDDSVSGKGAFWGRFIVERLFFLPFERSKEVRYAFSPAATGFDLADHPLVRQADVLHLHWINFGFLSVRGIERLLALGKPVVWTLHDMWAFTGGCHYSGECRRYQSGCGNCSFLKNPGEADLSFRRLQLKQRLWPAESNLTAVACSDWLAKQARASSLFAPFRVTNIPNPIDVAVFKPTGRAEARARLGLAPDKKYILFASAKIASKLKGFDYLKIALDRLVSQEPELAQHLALLVIGGGDTEQLQGLPLPVHALGYVRGDDELVKVYNAASVYVTPSVEDNLPNTVMEALACGTPAVGFRTGGIPEMIGHDVNGYLAEYRSPESLATGIVAVLRGDSDGRLSSGARETVLREFDEKVVAARYLALYQNVLPDNR